jgi:hypothetical protein
MPQNGVVAGGSFSLREVAAAPLPVAAAANGASGAAGGLAGYLPDYGDEEDCVPPVQQQQQQHVKSGQQPAAEPPSSSSDGTPGLGSSSAATGDVKADRRKIASKLEAQLRDRPDIFKAPLVDLLTLYKNQGRSAQQAKPMVLAVIRQSAAVKEVADLVFGPIYKLAQTALSVCL